MSERIDIETLGGLVAELGEKIRRFRRLVDRMEATTERDLARVERARQRCVWCETPMQWTPGELATDAAPGNGLCGDCFKVVIEHLGEDARCS
jgi:hypothetical protein